MSAEDKRVKKIATIIRQKTSLKDVNKINEVAEVVDEFSKYILGCYLNNINRNKK